MALLKYGSRGGTVKQLQQQLNKIGFNSGKVDGIFGPQTRSAVTNFQKKNNLKVDGIAGPQTFGHITKLLSAPKTPASTPANKPASAPANTPANNQQTVSAMPFPGPNATQPGYTINQLPGQAQGISDLLQQSQQMLSPLAQVQKDTAQSSFNQNMNQLSNQWASRGLLASGAAASQQSQAVQGLASQMANIDAQTQANALQNAYQLGNFQEGQRQFDLSHALQEGSLTGNYTPAGTRDLMNQILQQKSIAENPNSTPEQRQQASQAAENLRTQLGVMGVDASKMGSGVSMADMLKNISSGGFGQQTLDMRNFREQQNQFNQEMGLQRDRFGFEKERFGREIGLSEREQAFRERQSEIDNDLRQQGIDIDRAQQELSRLATMSDIEYQKYQQELGISQEEGNRATSQAMAQMAEMELEDAYKFLNMNAEQFAQDGVDVRALMEVLEQKAMMSGSNPFQ